MPRAATGEKWFRGRDGVPRKRVRLGAKKHQLKMGACRTDAQADKRSDLLAELAVRMTNAGNTSHAALVMLKKVAGASADFSEAAAFEMCDELIAGWRPDSTCPTFAAVCERWNTNELHQLYPDDVPLRKLDTTVRAAIATLRKHILPVVGTTPIDLITLEQCEEIKRRIAHVPQQDSRRQILTPLKTVLDLCVYPLKLIKRSPLPEGWLPSSKGPRVLQWLRPSEDLQLMQCTAVPLWRRVLWGTLARYGLRENEALVMAISQWDLTDAQPIGELFEHQTKTKKPRAWALDPSDADGLRAYLAIARAGAPASGFMFAADGGGKVSDDGLPAQLRADLLLAGVNRAELFTTTTTSRQLCVHDLRASFVTVKLALGWHRDLIENYTGQESDSTIKRYKRVAETLKEAARRARSKPEDFTPLADAIPELAAWLQAHRPAGHAMATGRAKHLKLLPTQDSIVESLPAAQALVNTETPIVPAQPDAAVRGPAEAAGHTLAAGQAALVAQIAAAVTGSVLAELREAGLLAPVQHQLPAVRKPRRR